VNQAVPDATPVSSETQSESALPGSYAWRRYFARVVDVGIVMAVIVVILMFFSIAMVAIVHRESLQAYVGWLQSLRGMNRFLDSIITTTLWLPIEAPLLSTLGTTPGKWVFGIKVRTQTGGKLAYPTAISRAVRVFFQGMALSIPLVSLVTLIVSYDRLTKTGVMFWDRDMRTAVSYEEMTNVRLTGCVIAVTLWAIINAWSAIRYIVNV
jgi:hypothetical protein